MTKKTTKPKPAKLKADEPAFGSAAVFRKTVSEPDAAHLQSAYGFRVESKNADGTFTMSATSGAFALYRAGK